MARPNLMDAAMALHCTTMLANECFLWLLSAVPSFPVQYVSKKNISQCSPNQHILFETAFWIDPFANSFKSYRFVTNYSNQFSAFQAAECIQSNACSISPIFCWTSGPSWSNSNLLMATLSLQLITIGNVFEKGPDGNGSHHYQCKSWWTCLFSCFKLVYTDSRVQHCLGQWTSQ